MEREPQLIRRFDDNVLLGWVNSRRTGEYLYLWERLSALKKTVGEDAMLDMVNLQYIVWLDKNPHVRIGEIEAKPGLRKSRTTPALSTAAKATSSSTATASATSKTTKKRQRTKSASSSASKSGRAGASARSGKAPRAEQEELSDDQSSQSSQSTRHEKDSDFNP